MSTPKLADRVMETSSSVGTGDFALSGPLPGQRSFASAFSVGDSLYYAIEGVTLVAEWEVGVGTLTGPATLRRDTVLSSSGGGSPVSFGAGLKNVFVSLPSAVALQAVGGSDRSYVHDQSVASATWTVTHNLGKRVSVTVVDSGGTTVIGQVRHDSDDQVTIFFSAPFGGKAYCN